MDETEDINRAVTRCPNCGAEYRAGFDTCADCGVPLEPIVAKAAGGGRGTIEIVERAAEDAEPIPVDVASGTGERPDTCSAEEHPSRVVLARLDRYDAYDVAKRLERSGIGARTTPPDADEVAAVIVHDTRLPEAQAVLADMGFAPWDETEADDEGEEDADVGSAPDGTGADPGDDAWTDANRRHWGHGTDDDNDDGAGEDDSSNPDTGVFVTITHEAASSAQTNASRVAGAGIDVRILVDRYPGDAATMADVCVPADRLDEARALLHIER